MQLAEPLSPRAHPKRAELQPRRHRRRPLECEPSQVYGSSIKCIAIVNKARRASHITDELPPQPSARLDLADLFAAAAAAASAARRGSSSSSSRRRCCGLPPISVLARRLLIGQRGKSFACCSLGSAKLGVASRGSARLCFGGLRSRTTQPGAGRRARKTPAGKSRR